MNKVTESVVEEAALDILTSLGYTTIRGNAIAPEAPVSPQWLEF